MPIEFRVDEDNSLLVAKLEGIVTPQEAAILLRGAPCAGIGSAIRRALGDLRPVTEIRAGFEEMHSARGLLEALEGSLERVALVTRPGYVQGMAAMFRSVAQDLAFEVELFEDLGAAERWLELQPGTVRRATRALTTEAR